MYFEKLVQQHQDAVQAMIQECIGDIQVMADICKDAIDRGNTIFLCGNGGSAADCQNIAAEFVGRYVKERQGLPAVAMTTDTSILTAVGIDYGFENIFRRQVEGLVRIGDVVIGISTSGNSENVMLALAEAKKKGAFSIALTGSKPNKMVDIAEVSVAIPYPVTARVQECHILIGHMVCDYVDKDF